MRSRLSSTICRHPSGYLPEVKEFYSDEDYAQFLQLRACAGFRDGATFLHDYLRGDVYLKSVTEDV